MVILNWNGRKFLEKFLPGLVASVQLRNAGAEVSCGAENGAAEAFDDAPCTASAPKSEVCSSRPERSEVIVADNASEDDSLEWLAENFPQVRTIVLDRNYGFTGGYNRAFDLITPIDPAEGQPEQEAEDSGSGPWEENSLSAQYYLLINSDIEVGPGWLEPLEQWMDTHPQCGACAPKLLSIGDGTMFEYAGAAGGLLDRYGYPFCRGRVPGRTEKDRGQYDSPADVFWVSGACMMVRAELYRRLGGFDERFFAHQEEIDLCWRMQLEGYSVSVVPASKVRHVGGGTLPNDSPWKLELNYRNNLLMLSNNLARTYALRYFRAQMGYPPDIPLDIPAADEGTCCSGIPATDNGPAASPRRTVRTKARADEAEIIRRAIRHGRRKASRTIFKRMLIDGCSSIAYLLTFRPKCFAAVIRGHRQFRRLRYRNDLKNHKFRYNGAVPQGRYVQKVFRHMYKDGLKNGIRNWLERTGGDLTVKGTFPKWIVWQAFWRGKNIFRYLTAFKNRTA